jgi:hypothetical protein
VVIDDLDAPYEPIPIVKNDYGNKWLCLCWWMKIRDAIHVLCISSDYVYQDSYNSLMAKSMPFSTLPRIHLTASKNWSSRMPWSTWEALIRWPLSTPLDVILPCHSSPAL